MLVDSLSHPVMYPFEDCIHIGMSPVKVDCFWRFSMLGLSLGVLNEQPLSFLGVFFQNDLL